GVNLCDSLVQVSLGSTPVHASTPQFGVKTHAVLTALLGKAAGGASRPELLHELMRCWRGGGPDAESQDELTCPGDDWLSLLPAVFLTSRLLIRPAVAKRVIRATVANYALDEAAVERIERMAK